MAMGHFEFINHIFPINLGGIWILCLLFSKQTKFQGRIFKDRRTFG